MNFETKSLFKNALKNFYIKINVTQVKMLLAFIFVFAKYWLLTRHENYVVELSKSKVRCEDSIN